jgi:hypothetical protein
MNRPQKHGEEKRTLAKRQSRVGGYLVLLLFAGFWNGIVGVFVGHLVKTWASGHADWFLTLFLVPFVLIGLLMIAGIVYSTLALFNPNIQIILDSNEVRLGEKISGKWRTTFGAGRVTELKLVLEGQEEARYTKGTSTYTDRALFVRIELYKTKIPREIERGTFEATIPADTMHSFEAPHNKILWTVVATGEIPRWPDLVENFAVTVLPMARNTLIARQEENAYDQSR